MRLMKRRPLVFLAGGVGLLALVVSLAIASAGTALTEHPAAVAPPPVPNAASIKKNYGGQTITFVGDSVGNSHKRDLMLAQYAKASDISAGGRQMPGHYCSAEMHIVSVSSPVATQMLHAVGIALASRIKGEDAVSVAIRFADSQR